jgi:hypothetical protein
MISRQRNWEHFGKFVVSLKKVNSTNFAIFFEKLGKVLDMTKLSN